MLPDSLEKIIRLFSSTAHVLAESKLFHSLSHPCSKLVLLQAAWDAGMPAEAQVAYTTGKLSAFFVIELVIMQFQLNMPGCA